MQNQHPQQPQYQPAPQPSNPPPQQTIIIAGQNSKSTGVAFLLTFFFGPIGLFYASVTGGIVMLIGGTIFGIITLGLGLILAWVGSIIWAMVAVNRHNEKLNQPYQQALQQPPAAQQPSVQGYEQSAQPMYQNALPPMQQTPPPQQFYQASQPHPQPELPPQPYQPPVAQPPVQGYGQMEQPANQYAPPAAQQSQVPYQVALQPMPENVHTWPQPQQATMPLQQYYQPPQYDEAVIVLPKPLSEQFKPLTDWMSKHKIILISAVCALAVLWATYVLFIKPDPIKHGKNAALGYCDCTEKYNNEMIKTNEGFINSFAPGNFTSRQEARQKLQAEQGNVEANNTVCNTAAKANYDKQRSPFSDNPKGLGKFDAAFSSQQGLCGNPSSGSQVISTNEQAEARILTIKDPEPDIEKIKNDLIGKSITGWQFNYLSEIKSANVSNTTRGTDLIEYQIDMDLRSTSGQNSHEAQIMATYVLGNEGWYFSQATTVYITYPYTAPLNQWYKVTHLNNCRYSVVDGGHNYWITEGGFFGTKYKGGPDGGEAYSFSNNQIYIMSREEQPVVLTFKYFPNN